MQMILDAQNRGEIDFYGKVIDQNGTPVAGAKVRGVIVFSSAEGTGNQNNFTVTDGNGQFKFNNLHGPNFGVVPSKDGYEYNERQLTNWSKNYKPDPANPMVLTMYKLQGAEPMVHQDFHFSIPCDGTPTNISLMTGKAIENGGDMTVNFIRNPVQIHRGKPFEWTLTLEVPGGGLTEIQDPYPYEAPENGYQENVTVGTGPNPQTYVDSTTKNYYYKSADGKYGRLTITLQADFQPPPTFFHIDAYLNPSGSRNLEYDRKKQIKP
jgi:hypothetical protein